MFLVFCTGPTRHLLEELEQAFPDDVESYRDIRATSAAVSFSFKCQRFCFQDLGYHLSSYSLHFYIYEELLIV